MVSFSNRKLIVAIDGPAGSGKSTTAKYLAQKLKLPYIDSGAMYRAVTLEAMRKKISFKDKKKLAQIAKNASIRFANSRGYQKVYLNGQDVTTAIREPELTKNVAFIAREASIRREMVKKQRLLGQKEGAVMDGRDIGSVVFPKADYKFYFDADLETRVKRRWRDLKASGKPMDIKQVEKEIRIRDLSDFKRKTGALKVARGAHVLDTTGLTIAQTTVKILNLIGKKR
jgi:cytidylate kinase